MDATETDFDWEAANEAAQAAVDYWNRAIDWDTDSPEQICENVRLLRRLSNDKILRRTLTDYLCWLYVLRVLCFLEGKVNRYPAGDEIILRTYSAVHDAVEWSVGAYGDVLTPVPAH